VKHGIKPSFSLRTKETLKNIANKHGVWYEGFGGDIDDLKSFFGDKRNYKGSWDDLFAQSIKGYPVEFLYTLFTNTKENKQEKYLVNPKKTIFDNILENQKNIGYFKDRSFNKETLEKFLKSASDTDCKLYDWSHYPATRVNVSKFIKSGEAKMWPKNWQEYPYNAGKFAKKAEEKRNKFLMSLSSGVYVMGEDHLTELKKIDGSLKVTHDNGD